MNQSKKNQIELGIIIIFLGFGAFKMWQSKANLTKSASLPKIAEAAAFNLDEAKIKFESLKTAAQEKTDNLGGRARNIFLKAAGVSTEAQIPETARQGLILEGTIWGGEKNMAIISGRVVCEGDVIDNAKVLKIISNKVVLSQNGSEIELKI